MATTVVMNARNTSHRLKLHHSAKTLKRTRTNLKPVHCNFLLGLTGAYSWLSEFTHRGAPRPSPSETKPPGFAQQLSFQSARIPKSVHKIEPTLLRGHTRLFNEHETKISTLQIVHLDLPETEIRSTQTNHHIFQILYCHNAYRLGRGLCLEDAR